MDDFDLVRGVATEVLEAELKRRKSEMPKPMDQIDWSRVKDYVVDAVESLEQGEGLPKDFEHNLMEMTVESIYGFDIWDWWNWKQ